MEMSDPLVQVKGLTVKAGRRHLLSDIDWTVERGQQWVVFGLNGCGKTTLLSAISGYRRYSSGSVSLFGERTTAENIFQIRKKVGWVSGSFFDTHYKNESALEIILAGKTGTLGLDGSIGVSDVRLAKEMLGEIGLADKVDMPFCTLSKGERQNIMLIRALINDPKILILDEPCSGLDIVSRERVLHMVRRLINESRVTVVYVTHYAEEALDVFTHALLLKGGKRYYSGGFDEAFSDGVVSGLLGYPAVVDRDHAALKISFDFPLDERGWLA